jgi:hypothetical protein
MNVIGKTSWKMYWFIVAIIPLIPSYVLGKYHSAQVCSDDGICFRYGHYFLNPEGWGIIFLSVALLWPICIWHLIGKHVFVGRLQPSFVTKFRANRAAIFLGRFYWLIVAVIPLLFWYLFGTFQAPAECVGNGDCIKFYLPLDAVSKVAVLISCCLLWPMCLWKLVGKAVRRIRRAAPA